MSKLEKTINILFCFFILLLPWQTRWIWRWGEIGGGYSEFLRVSLYASDILLGLLLGLGAYYAWRFRRRVQAAPVFRGYIWLAVGLWELLLFISIFRAADPALAAYKYVLFLAGVGLFWLLGQNFFRWRWLEISLVLSGTVQALLAVAQFAAQAMYVNKWLGLAGHDAAQSGTAVVLDLLGNRYLRSYAGLDHPNILGGLLALALILAVIMAARAQERVSRFERMGLLAAIPMLSAGLFFSFSRTAWLAAGLGMLFLLAQALIRKRYLSARKIFMAASFAAAMFLILACAAGDLLITRLTAAARVEQLSLAERSSGLAQSGRLIDQNFWTGVGAGQYIPALIADQPGQPWYAYQPVHNTYLLIWAELGLLGFFAFFALLYLLLRAAYNQPESALIWALAVLMLFDHWLWSYHFGLLLFWLVLGLSRRRADDRGQEGVSLSRQA